MVGRMECNSSIEIYPHYNTNIKIILHIQLEKVLNKITENLIFK